MKFKFILCLACLLSLCSFGETIDSLKMIVISDTHVMEPSLVKKDGEALTNYIDHDRKMLKDSPALMEEATRRILERHPQVVLVCGDLTKDGETVSHHFLCDRYLSRIRKAGIKVFVVPGNHDVNNPHAVAFYGDKTKRVPSPKADEFARIYNDYGYGDAIARDEHSLSYVARLSDKVRLLALDACKYEENDFNKDSCVTAGRLKPETLTFIERQAADARANGCTLLAMMHHGVVQHWKYQEKAMSEYLVDDWRKVASLLEKAGIRVVFTGHFHAQDIAVRGKLYDVETGSLVSYPSPMRYVTLQGNTMTIKTNLLSGKGVHLPAGENLQQYAKGFATEGVHSVVGSMLPAKLPQELRTRMCDEIAKGYVAHLAGDEQLSEAQEAEIKSVAHDIKKYSWKYSIMFKVLTNSLFTDLKPQDNNITLTLKK